MKWTVVWKTKALNDLAELWVESTDRSSMAFASDLIDELLATEPLVHGESRDDGARLLVVAPLVVRYYVSVDDCMVTVTAVWQGQRRDH